jgi:hypothetical protein
VLYNSHHIASVFLWGRWEYSSDYGSSLTAVEIHADENGAPGALVATSSPAGVSWRDGDVELEYTFPAPVALPAGSYWLVPVYAGGARTYLFGATGNPYSDGQLGLDPNSGTDLYFRVAWAGE